MGTIRVSADRSVGAPADAVYGYLADTGDHVQFLPPAFSDFQVESGGIGAGTIFRFKLSAGGRTRDYRMQMAEPEPGRVLSESDTNSSLVTTFTVTPEGDTSRVAIETTWEGAAGIGGLFERLFAPRVMRSLYADELDRLDAFARERAGAAPAAG
jgi:Polyketide cyclase / dehydrase and lipid transport